MLDANDYPGVQSWGTIVVIGLYWHVKAVSSLIIVFIIQHSLPKRWKLHFLKDLDFKNFPGEQAPEPPYIVSLP